MDNGCKLVSAKCEIDKRFVIRS